MIYLLLFKNLLECAVVIPESLLVFQLSTLYLLVDVVLHLLCFFSFTDIHNPTSKLSESESAPHFIELQV